MANTEAITKAKQVKERYESEWMALEDVVAVGIGLVDDKPGIVVSVKSNVDSVRQKIPSEIDDVQVKVVESGEIKAG